MLKPVELLYRGVNRARRALYRSGALPSKRLPRPVVSVGNRAIGGSGKTPMVIAIARHFVDSGRRPVVLTRGYGRRVDAEIARVDAEDPARFGDEPVVIARHLPEVPVVVGADRHAAGLWFLERGDCDLFLLDDGFQHLRLHRDVDIAIESPDARWLREGPSALSDADLVVHRAPAAERGALQHIATLEPSALIHGGRRLEPSDLAGRPVVAFAGLADNDQFFKTLESLGAALVERASFSDHHPYAPADLSPLRTAAVSASALLVTSEKDWVKLHDPGIACLEASLTLPASFYTALDSLLA